MTALKTEAARPVSSLPMRHSGGDGTCHRARGADAGRDLSIGQGLASRAHAVSAAFEGAIRIAKPLLGRREDSNRETHTGRPASAAPCC
eukprot:1131657-Prymnesium_polylepis.1